MEIPGFTIKEKISAGSVTDTWLAHQVSLDRTVVLKILTPRFAGNQKEVNTFVNEARRAAKLRHPNLVQLFDVRQHEDTFYLVLEHVSGTNLQDRLDTRGGMTQKHALQVFLSIADALAYAWDKGKMTHRYLHPKSLLIEEHDNTVKLSGLGVTKPTEPTRMLLQLRAGSLNFSPYYLSPEQAKCETKIDQRSDIYAAGALLYHLLTGKPPFEDEPLAAVPECHQTATIPNPRDIKPSLTPGVSQFLSRLMAKNPAHRYQDWTQVLADANKLLAGRFIPSKQASAFASTIASASTAKRITGPAAPPAAAQRVQRRPSVPALAHLLAWGLIVSAWGYLAFTRLSPPASPPPTSPDGPTISTPPRRPRRTGPRRSSSPATPDQNPSRPDVANTDDPAPPQQEPPPESQPDAAPPVSPIDTVRANIATLMVSQQLDAALTLLATEKEYLHSDEVAALLDQLQSFIVRVGEMDQVIAAGFKRRIGDRVQIKHNNVDRLIRILDVRGNVIHAEIDTVINGTKISRGVTFEPATLSAQERLQWLGDPRSPETFAMKYLLLMWNNDPAAAAAIADQCGPMAGKFKELAQARL